jgi:hypothetical protein
MRCLESLCVYMYICVCIYVCVDIHIEIAELKQELGHPLLGVTLCVCMYVRGYVCMYIQKSMNRRKAGSWAALSHSACVCVYMYV